MIRFRFRAYVLFVLVILACAVPSVVQPPVATPTVMPAPGTAVAVLVAPATVLPSPVTQAPFCVSSGTPVSSPVGCTLPARDQRSQFCTNKQPYTLIALPQSATYTVLSNGFSCSPAGLKDNLQLVTCTGAQSSSFSLRVCNPTCALAPTSGSVAPSGTCPQGYNYSTDQKCCQAGQGDRNGCVTLNYDTTACGVVDCSRIKDMSTCSAKTSCKWVLAVKSKPAYCTLK
jgi:hypothetical protein